MFRPSAPTLAQRDAALAASRDAPFTYAAVGATRHAPGAPVPPGHAVNHRRTRVGEGASAFGRAVAALRAWRMADTGWTAIHPPAAPAEPGQVVAMVVRCFGLWSLHPCRVVYVVDEPAPDAAGARRWGFAYGTLPGHAAAGEERFLVEWLPDGGVWYDLYAFSRPAHPLMRLGLPVARRLQRRFARDSARAVRAFLATTQEEHYHVPRVADQAR